MFESVVVVYSCVIIKAILWGSSNVPRWVLYVESSKQGSLRIY